jgi:hypothetical protein
MPIGEEISSLVRHDIIASAVKAAPPVSAVSAIWMGISLPGVLMVLTIIYTALQIIFLLRDKLFSRNRRGREK